MWEYTICDKPCRMHSITWDIGEAIVPDHTCSEIVIAFFTSLRPKPFGSTPGKAISPEFLPEANFEFYIQSEALKTLPYLSKQPCNISRSI